MFRQLFLTTTPQLRHIEVLQLRTSSMYYLGSNTTSATAETEVGLPTQTTLGDINLNGKRSPTFSQFKVVKSASFQPFIDLIISELTVF